MAIGRPESILKTKESTVVSAREALQNAIESLVSEAEDICSTDSVDVRMAAINCMHSSLDEVEARHHDLAKAEVSLDRAQYEYALREETT